MNINISIKTPNLEREREDTEELLKKVLYQSMVKMEEIAKTKAPVDTGNLRARIHLNPENPGATEYTLSDGVEYGVYVEYGTKPHFVPITPLKGWAGRVLGDPNIAYAIREKISVRGVPAQPFFRPAIHEVKYKWLPLITKQVFGS